MDCQVFPFHENTSQRCTAPRRGHPLRHGHQRFVHGGIDLIVSIDKATYLPVATSIPRLRATDAPDSPDATNERADSFLRNALLFNRIIR